MALKFLAWPPFDFAGVDNTSGGGAAAGTVDDPSQGEGAALLALARKHKTPMERARISGNHFDPGPDTSFAKKLNAGVSGVSGVASSSKGEPKVSDMPKKPILAARYCTGSADAKLFWTRLQRIFNELAPEDERLRETERAAWKNVKGNNGDSFKCTEDKMKELTIQFLPRNKPEFQVSGCHQA